MKYILSMIELILGAILIFCTDLCLAHLVGVILLFVGVIQLILEYNEARKTKKANEIRDKVLIKLSKDSTNLQKDKLIDDYILSYRKVNDIKEENLSASPEGIRNILMEAEKNSLKSALDKGASFATEEEKNKWIDDYYKSYKNIYKTSE